jgi:hydroxyacylglutathione hydrolase
MISVIPIPVFNDNYIWVIRNERHAAVVDPGHAAPVLSYLQQQELQLTAILVTHHHHDHTDGIPALLQQFPAPVYGPKNELVPDLSVRLGEGDPVYLDELALTLSVLDTPGHTSGHISYYDGSRLFCGDTMFACGCGRLFEGTPQQMYASLQKFCKLPDQTLVYCAHEYTRSNIIFARIVEPGNQALAERELVTARLRHHHLPTLPSTIQEERATNPFLRCDQSAVRKSVCQHFNQLFLDNTDVFSALREWKNTF